MKAVITGDIVDSSTLDPESKGELLKCFAKLEEELKAVAPFRMELFRGDSFQLLVDVPEQAAKIAVLIRAALIQQSLDIKNENRLDARISIGVGEVTFMSDSVVTSDGEAFQYSGRELDYIGKKRLTIRTPWADANRELEVSTGFADDVITNWSPTQARMIYLSLLTSKSKKDISDMVGSSPQNTRNVLTNAKEALMKKYVERYEELILSHKA